MIVTRELSRENHIWLNSLSENLNEVAITELIVTTQELRHNDEKNHADSLWEVVTRINTETVKKVSEDDGMCKALAEIMKPQIDEAFDNGFHDGFKDGMNDGKLLAFRNMIKDGISRELAQKYTEISDQLAEQVLTEV